MSDRMARYYRASFSSITKTISATSHHALPLRRRRYNKTSGREGRQSSKKWNPFPWAPSNRNWLRLKTKKTKMNTTRKTKRKLKHQYKRSKTREQFLKICTKASRRSKKRRMKCRLIRLRTNRNRLPRIAGPWNSSMLTATSKLKLSLFPISCNARCKSKTNKFCLTLWSVRITFFYTLGVAKCGLCQ